VFFFEANFDDIHKHHLPTHITVQVIPQVYEKTPAIDFKRTQQKL